MAKSKQVKLPKKPLSRPRKEHKKLLVKSNIQMKRQCTACYNKRYYSQMVLDLEVERHRSRGMRICKIGCPKCNYNNYRGIKGVEMVSYGRGELST